MSNNIDFADEPSTVLARNEDSWKLLIVDDEKDIHDITKLSLKSLKYKNKPISFVSAYSGKEAIEFLSQDSDFAIVLLDIRMETNDAGLDVARYIRQVLRDSITRIIIRTGQPGDIPEHEIIDAYDINDFKSKTDLTVDKLFSSIRTAIAQYDHINQLSHLNADLEKRIEKALKIQQQQQETLLLQNRASQMGELLNMLAHQWRQPLSRISAVASQLKLSLALGDIDADAFNKQVDGIETYTNELSNTIDEFRTVYEPSSLVKTVPLSQLLEKPILLIQNSCVQQNIKINLMYFTDKKDIQTSTEVYQVILSILKNSQEAFLKRDVKEPHIDISVTEDSDYINIQIEDNAGGIENKNLPMVFDPYFSTKENKNGHGLGLYMSKNIIVQHCHGRLSVSTTETGACFTISLANK
jgi:signal transduction histidine kinase